MKLIVALLWLALMTAGTHVYAQNKKTKSVRQPQTEQARAAAQLARSREDFIKATKEYKASLEKLLALYEGNERQAQEKFAQTKGLWADGFISKKELDESAQAVIAARTKIAEVRQQITTAETRIAETLVESQAEEQMAKAQPLSLGKLITTTSYIRYNGPGAWSLADAWKVQRFFQGRFRRPLPISAFGQSSIHDRWGLDHHNAMDVPVNPDGPEGQALMLFLRTNGIPFSAFRNAIPGTATGPHIHVGRPSHRQ